MHDGIVADSALPTQRPRWQSQARAVGRRHAPLPPAASGETLEIVFRPDPTVYDGRFANNGWLQELPKALTRLTWDNTAQLAPATAERLGVGNEDVVELELDGRRLSAPVWIVPGHAAGVVIVHLGYGRARAGHVGTGVGFNAYPLRPSDRPWSARGLVVRKTGEHYRLASTQHHHSMEGATWSASARSREYRARPALRRHAHSDGRTSRCSSPIRTRATPGA